MADGPEGLLINLQELAEAKGFSVEQLEKFGLRDGVYDKTNTPSVVMPIYNADGQEYRLAFRSSAEDGKGFHYDGQKDKPNVPYGLQRPVPVEKFIYLVEGQSDCWALWSDGLPALGIPGATSTACLLPEHIAPAKAAIIVQEPGEAGERFPHRVAQQLYDHGYDGECYAIQLPGFKDPREAYQQAREYFRKILKEAWEGRRPIERQQVAAQDDDLKIMSYQELVKARQVESVKKWLVEALLGDSGLMLLAGRPKAGKSTLARNLAKAVASGGHFLGRRCEQGTVLWVGLEESVQDLIEALELLGASHLPIVYRVDPFHKDQQAWLYKAVNKIRPALTIIDTIGSFSEVKDMNDYSQVVKATKIFLDLRGKFGTAFCLNHHTNANNKVLGSTYWEGLVDTSIILSANDDGTRFLKTVGQRGLTAVGFESVTLDWDHETGAISVEEPKFITDRKVAEQRLVAFLSDGMPRTREELALHGGRSASISRQAVDSLLSQGTVVVSGEGTKSSPKVYTLRNTTDSSSQSFRDEESGESRVESGESPVLGEESYVSAESEESDLLEYAKEKGL